METSSKRPQAKYAPGELQKTRQNLGQLEEEEAAFMMKRLGGEIGIEKTEEITEDTLKKVRSVRKPISSSRDRTHSVQRTKPSASSSVQAEGASVGGSFTGAVQSGLAGKKYRLPSLNVKNRQL